MASIKAIESRSVHQIQSGQVIVDLTSVVKELVENGLDAGATSIEVRFKHQGLDSIEVQDNGKGIAPTDFDTIALKHYTSKLSSYEDLTSLDTFGFRGEALSSLCALSKFHIITARTEDGAVGKKLDFEQSGKLKGTSVVAAQRGTTVAVENLFTNLPVRRKELEKNIKREYGKAVSHLYAYACISAGVRLSVSNQMPKGKKVTAFSTKSNTTTKENITNVFGAKTLLALVKLDLHLEMEPSKGPSTQSARNWSTQAIDRSMEVHVQGHISKPVFGEGRQAPDRQMFFINSRPCALPQVSKAFNDVYKSFNVSQSPFIFANLVMDTSAYDVNVSPDKRSIMLHEQTALLDRLKASLTELFEHTDHTVPQSQLPNKKFPSYKPLIVPRRESANGPTPTVDEASDEDSDRDEHDSESQDSPTLTRKERSNGASASLIEDWIGKDTELRKGPPVHRDKVRRLSDDVLESRQTVQAEGPTRSTELADVQRQERLNQSPTAAAPSTAAVDIDPQRHAEDQPMQISATTPQQDPMSTPYDDLFSQRPAHLLRRVRDFNALIDHEHDDGAVAGSEQSETPLQDSHDAETTEATESEIPAITTSAQKPTPGPVQNAFDHMRPRKTPIQNAEITIGDTTTKTVIGSSSPYKRRRVHQPANSQIIPKFGGSPLAARGLRNFAAPGSQMEMNSSRMAGGSYESAQSVDDASAEPSAEEDEGPPEQAIVVTTDSPPRKATALSNGHIPTSDPLDALMPAPADDDHYDDDYVDEHEKKIQEDEKVARLIQEAELAADQPTEDNLRRASQVLKNTGNRKESTLRLAQYIEASTSEIGKSVQSVNAISGVVARKYHDETGHNVLVKDEIDDTNAESRLSLTVNKSDFERMTITGQFNLGFVLAVRPASTTDEEDEIFIIDQHAADEKYNYERLQRTITLQSQRLVRPKALELTAVEEEIILNNAHALKANGFEVETTSHVTDEDSADRRCRLLTLPISGEKTFEPSDLEELIHLLSEARAGSSEIPRPKKVQSMLAMRACRSSIMVGKTLTVKQMQKIVKHMGEMEKPWNCPHGRPTMRHLAGLGAWSAWSEGEAIDEDDTSSGTILSGGKTDWQAFLRRRK